MSVHQVKIFLTDDAHAELMDRYLDKEDELRKFVFDGIKSLALIAKVSKLNKKFAYNEERDDERDTSHPKKRIRKQDTMPLENAKLEKYTIPEDPSWLPENLADEADAIVTAWFIGTTNESAKDVRVRAVMKSYFEGETEADSDGLGYIVKAVPSGVANVFLKIEWLMDSKVLYPGAILNMAINRDGDNTAVDTYDGDLLLFDVSVKFRVSNPGQRKVFNNEVDL